MSDTISIIEELKPDAAILGGLHIGDFCLNNIKGEVKEWLTNSKIENEYNMSKIT